MADQSSQGQPSQQQHSDQPTLPAAPRASHSTLKAHSRSARAIDSSASSRTATLSDQALTTSPLTSSIGAVERFYVKFDGQDTDSYDFIKEKTSKMIGDTITSLFVGRSPAEKVQILALIRKNEGITFDLQLSDTDGQDNDYHVRKVYTPKAQDQTPETFIRRSAQEFADDSIRQIRDVGNEGAINIRKITLSLELPKIVEANNLQKYPKKILQGLGIVDKSGKTLDPSSMPGWRKLQSTLNNLIPNLKTYGGTGVHLDKESALYQAALKIAAAQGGIPSKEAIGKALEQIVKVYHQYVADQLEKQQELLLHGRPHPFSHVADKLGNWLGVQPGQRHKIVSDKVSVAYRERRPITSPFGSGGVRWYVA